MEIIGERALIVTFWLNKQRKKQKIQEANKWLDTIFLGKLRKNVELNMKMGTIFWDTQNENGNYILGRREYYSTLFTLYLMCNNINVPNIYAQIHPTPCPFDWLLAVFLKVGQLSLSHHSLIHSLSLSFICWNKFFNV